MNSSIKVNNQIVVKILEAIEEDKNRYPELWKIISDEELDNSENNSVKNPKVKFIGNLDFLNLKRVESPKLLTELTERINRGEIKLNVFDCCYLIKCFSFMRKSIEEKNTKKSEEDKQLTPQIKIKDLDLFIMMILYLLKKDSLLCPNHNKLTEEAEKKEIKAPKGEENSSVSKENIE